MKIVYTTWFSSLKCIGVVITENERGVLVVGKR